MFHYEEPIFKKKKLLRIEMLEQLRDYPRNYFKLHFQGFSNGIMDGCQITWDNAVKYSAGDSLLCRKHLFYGKLVPNGMSCRK